MQVHTHQWVTVDLGEAEEREVTLSYLYGLFKWEKEFFTEDNKVFENRAFSTSHSWIEQIFVRDATEDDIAIERVIRKIKAKKPAPQQSHIEMPV